ncbi:MAG: LacI family DNA-binding transcriptional regulator [Faecalibacterium sp.]|nr:LacI family DNA-binding transcriptional regulator [Faecalibacterium sp.]
MNDKRVTVRDIAERMKVSSGTVHRALNDKPGVGEELRSRIRQVAEEMGYRPNVLAATLKMKPLRIVLAFPQQERGDRFYYHYVWQGCRDRMQTYSDYRLETVEMPYSRDGRDDAQSFSSGVDRLLEAYNGEIDGVIAGGLMRGPDALAVERLNEMGVPVVMLCESVAAQSSLCVVQSNHYADGQIAAELLRSHIAPGGKILVCAGSPEMNSNIENLRGFQDGLGDDYRLKTIYGVFEHEQLEQKLYDSLSSGNYQGAYSVAARSTPPLCDAIRRLNLQQKLCVVGSEVFPESAQALQDGTLNYLLYKKPREQGARGADILLEQLLRHNPPQKKQVQLNSAIVIRSNVQFYLQELECEE